jgi:translation initiation factor IF-1
MSRDASERGALIADGTVIESSRGFFVVAVDGFAKPITTKLSGRMNVHRVRVMPGDRVTIEIAAIDPSRGRITRRL